MTWNELIYQLKQIPEERREEEAIFRGEDFDSGDVIDNLEITPLSELPHTFPDNTPGKDETTEDAYYLTP